jgi:hypothetical protein
MTSKLEDALVPLARRCPHADIPPNLDTLVSRALSRDPGVRFPDAHGFGHALDAVPIAEHTPAPHVPPSAIFSTEAATATMSLVEALAGQSYARSPVARCRAALVCAINDGDAGKIIVAYLDLARALVDEHRLEQAIIELERAVELLSGVVASAPVWRLLLTLAALYDGNGDRAHARGAVRLACDAAASVGSRIGRMRAEQLAKRLGAFAPVAERGRAR